MKSITIGKSEQGLVKLDLNRLIVTRGLLSADSGGGKSFLLRKLIEEVSETTQTIVLDLEGEFASLREIRDMVLVGPDGEVPAEPIAAGVLCRKLMEMNLSAVIDLSELPIDKKQSFIKNFCETMVALPKQLWHRCFVFIDEIHDAAPEGEKSVSEDAVASLSSKGRKRGYCLIGATQRVSKLSKNVAAGLKNQFLGTFSLDTDIARAAKSLGFDSKRHSEIRDLSSEPGLEGEFFCFGPAFNHRGVLKMRGGKVKTTHPEAGHGKAPRPPAPSAKIKGVLSELTDLPKLAQEEAKTLAEAKRQIADLHRQLKTIPKPAAVEVISKKELSIIRNLRKGLEEAMKVIADITATGFGKTTIDPKLVQKAVESATGQIVKMVESDLARKSVEFDKLKAGANKLLLQLQKLLAQDTTVDVNVKHNEPFSVSVAASRARSHSTSGSAEQSTADRDLTFADGLDGPQQRLLNSLAFWELIGVASPSNTAVAFKAGYSPTSSAYEKPRGKLRKLGLIKFPDGDRLSLTDDGRSKATFPTDPGTLRQFHEEILGILDSPQQRLLKPLLAAYPNILTNDELAASSGYAVTSSAYEKPRGKLRKLELIVFRDGGIAADALLFPENLQ